jgi:hypothetical protein
LRRRKRRRRRRRRRKEGIEKLFYLSLHDFHNLRA